VEVSAVSITKREVGSAVVFESLNAGVVAFCTQGVCYVNPVCTAGLKTSILTLMPEEAKLQESLTQGQFLELLAQKAK
jgi:hypothetical protein